jgi:hypothetical protein
VVKIQDLGKKSRKGRLHRSFGTRQIADHVDKRFVHFGIAKSDFPKERRAPLCGGPADVISGIGISGIPWTKCLCISALRCLKP